MPKCVLVHTLISDFAHIKTVEPMYSISYLSFRYLLLSFLMILLLALCQSSFATSSHTVADTNRDVPAAEDPLALYPEDIRRIKQRGKLIVAQFHGERKGFFMFDEQHAAHGQDVYLDAQGRHVIGHDIVIAQRIAERLGVDLEIRRNEKSFTDVCKTVARGEADIGLSKLTITMDRGQYVNFTEPYMRLKIGVLINRLREVESRRSGSLREILNHPETTIAIQSGTSWVAYGRDLFPQAELLEYPTMRDALNAVISGDAMAFLNDEWNISVLLNDSPEVTLRARLAFLPGQQSGIAMAVNPHQPNLLAFLNLMVESDHLRTDSPALLRNYFSANSAQKIANTLLMAEKGQQEALSTNLALALLFGIFFLLLLIWIRLAFSPPPIGDNPSSQSERQEHTL